MRTKSTVTLPRTRNGASKKTRENRSFHYIAAKFSRILIIIVILLAFIAVIIAILSIFFFNDETLVKSKITDLTTDYYENYFYTHLENSEKFKELDDKSVALEKYNRSGIDLTLKELLLYDNRRNDKEASYLSSQCDINETRVKIYPEPPYDAKSYHVKYDYSCNF